MTAPALAARPGTAAPLPLLLETPRNVDRWEAWPTVVAFILLTYASWAFIPLFRSGAELHGDSDPVVQLLWLPIYGAVAFLLLKDRNAASAGRLRVPLALRVFVLFTAASVLWSAAPGITIRRVVALALTGMCGVFLASRFSPVQVLKLFRAVVLVTAAASALLLVAAPGLAQDPLITTGHNAMRGVFLTKNLFGETIVLGLCAELILFFFVRGRLAVHLGIALLLLPLLVLSGSATSLLVLGGLAGAIAFSRGMSRRPGSAAGLVLIGVAGVVSFVGFFSGKAALLHLVGRDSTLTNRTRIWDAVMSQIHLKPMLGWGYGAFWQGRHGPSLAVSERLHGAVITHAHNGFLDMWAQLGVIGLVLAAVVLIVLFRDSLAHVVKGDVLRGAVPFGFLAFLVFFNLDETTLLVQNSIYTVLLFYVACTCGRQRHPASRP